MTKVNMPSTDDIESDYSTKVTYSPSDRKNKARLKSKYQFLRAVQRLGHQDLDRVSPFFNDEGCSALYECVYNVLINPNIKGRKKLKNKLDGKKLDLRYLANPKYSNVGKRKRTKKVGGAILSTILGTAVPLLLSYLLGK
jgi:hypothetical protein